MFRMSLGAKELFHSNFLEYLWELNNGWFIEMINDFIPKTKSLPSGVNYKMGRELENFDICIYNETGKKKKDYQLIIENKVKSIPYKEQLNGYEKKAKNAKDCRFVLLTLSKDFPDKDDDAALQNWVVIGYDDLLSGIQRYYLKSNNIFNKVRSYIQDYCDFIKQLNDLKTNVVLPVTNVEDQMLFDENVINELKKIRLHDLYIKVRISWFLSELKNILEYNGITPKVVHNYKEIYATHKRKGVYLNVDVNQGVGQIAAWIYDKDGADGNTFEIVIQGRQYRHGISQRLKATPQAENKFVWLNILYDELKNSFKDAFDFLNFKNFNSIGCVKPDKAGAFKNSGGITKNGPFCCYDNSYIYRYVDVKNLIVKDLLKKMSDDIVQLYNNIPRL